VDVSAQTDVTRLWRDLSITVASLQNRYATLDQRSRALQRQLEPMQSAYTHCNDQVNSFPAKKVIQQLQVQRTTLEAHSRILGQQRLRLESVRRSLEESRGEIEKRRLRRSLYDRAMAELVDRFKSEFVSPMEAEVIPAYELLIQATESYLKTGAEAADSCRTRNPAAAPSAKTFGDKVIAFASWVQSRIIG
jgi:hypothetical protein